MERQNPFHPHESANFPLPSDQPLWVNLVRGQVVESRHRVQAALFENGQLTCWGDSSYVLFPRSTIKPLQALLWVGQLEKISQKEIALACGSHEGEKYHIEVLGDWLERSGLSPENLECGAHEPLNISANRALWASGVGASRAHNNCSGNHAGLMAYCAFRGWSFHGYSNFDHPIQGELRRILGSFSDGQLLGPWGIDGCGIPTYSTSIGALALAFAQFSKPDGHRSGFSNSAKAIHSAIAKYPEYSGGSSSFATELIKQSHGGLLAKVGAEGVYVLWVPGQAIGAALKCEDGSARAAEVAAQALAVYLGFASSGVRLEKNYAGEVVGQIHCV